MLQAEAGADDRLAGREGIVGEANTWLGQEPGVVGGERGGADGGVGVDHSIG